VCACASVTSGGFWENRNGTKENKENGNFGGKTKRKSSGTIQTSRQDGLVIFIVSVVAKSDAQGRQGGTGGSSNLRNMSTRILGSHKNLSNSL
jgi:hypothetical protein